jgi:hypothetical protein
LNVSRKLLNDGFAGFDGLRSTYKGSFSEEDDSLDRLHSTTIFQLDPIDGTGDMVDTYQSKMPTGPTTLISKLTRDYGDGTLGAFKPVSGIIYDVLHEFGIVSNGKDIGLYKMTPDGKLKSIPYELTLPTWKEGDTVRINRRVSYPQLTFDGPFMDYLRNKVGLKIEVVPVGGAGIFAMQVFRNYIQPKDSSGKDFADLQPITIGFNAQPDWKTWDTNPTEVIADALGMPMRTDIYGNPLKANAANPTLKDMHHTTGYVLSTSNNLRNILTSSALYFEKRNPDSPLLHKDYDYSKAIIGRLKN